MTIRRTTLGVIVIAAGLTALGASVFTDESAGIELRRGAIVLYGSASASECPAWVLRDRVIAAAPETEKIRRERVPPGSARYQILASQRLRRIRAAARRIAHELEVDCVVFKRDVRDARGLRIVDVTARVAAVLRIEDVVERGSSGAVDR